MSGHRLRLLQHCIAGMAALALAATAQAQTVYPGKTVRIIVPSSPGGGTDILGRMIAQELTRTMGQQFVVENRPGAGQIIGIEAVARAAPDGYTLLMAASAIVLNQMLFKKVPYDTLRDFAPITNAAALPNILCVHPALPAKTVRELIALAKARPGHLAYSSAGVGTSPHLSMELFRSMAGITLVHVPYKGAGPATVDLVAGQVQLSMPNVLTALPQVRAGRLRALGVTSAKRAVGLPDIPAIAESGVPGYEAIQWYGLLAPAGTPREVVQRLYVETSKALLLPETKTRLAGDGAEPVANTPEEFAAFIRREMEKWAKVVQSAGIQSE